VQHVAELQLGARHVADHLELTVAHQPSGDFRDSLALALALVGVGHEPRKLVHVAFLNLTHGSRGRQPRRMR
jgi:hypothetical protein